MTPQRFSLPLTILLASLAIPSLLYATDVSGPVSGTWMLAGSPYNVVGEITVPANQSLTIEPGVQVIFQGWYKFCIYGCLIANGTQDDSIYFSGFNWNGLRFYETSSHPDSSILNYCHISNGLSAGDGSSDSHGGAIYAYNSSKLRISHCLLSGNRTADILGSNGVPYGGSGQSVTSGCGGAIYLTQSNAIIANNTICNNWTGNAYGGQGSPGLPGNPNGDPGGSGGNGTAGYGGAIYCYNCNPLIQNNSIHGNRTGNGTGGHGGYGGGAYGSSWVSAGDGGAGGFGDGGSGGGIASNNTQTNLKNNLFYGNSTGSGSGGNGGHGGDVEWGSIGIGGSGGNGGNGSGGNGAGVFLSGNIIEINNATTSNHTLGVGGGGSGGLYGWGRLTGYPGNPGSSQPGQGAMFCGGWGSVAIANSIFWETVSIPIVGNATVNYSCVHGGYPGIGNINSDPLFISNPLGCFFLAQYATGQTRQSPCVNTGCPDSLLFLGTTRTDGVQDTGIVDMGFHYTIDSHQAVLACTPQTFQFITVQGDSNPTAQILQIGNIGIDSLFYSIDETIPWLNIYPPQGGPLLQGQSDTKIVLINISGIQVGEYAGSITISALGALNSPDTVRVYLRIGEPIIVVDSTNLSFTAGYSGANPPNQYFNVMNTGLGSFSYSVIDSIPWLTVSPQISGPVPPIRTETVSVDISGLTAGTYTGNIWVVASGISGSPQAIRVTLTIANNLAGTLSGVLNNWTYCVTGNIYVTNGSSLLIQPGAVLNFNPGCMFTIEGNLTAVGTETDSIIFRANAPTSGWGGLKFNNASSSSSQMTYCLITGSDSSGIELNNSSLEISSCTISGNSAVELGGGIKCGLGQPLIVDCNITDNSVTGGTARGGGIYVAYGHPIIRNCWISHNYLAGTSYNRGAGIYCYFGDAEIEGSIIEKNSFYNGISYGGGVYCNTDSTSIVNCTITENNTTGSVECNGGGIYLYSSLAEIRNCLIAYNRSNGIYVDWWIITPSVNYTDLFSNHLANLSGNIPPNLGILTQTNLNGDSCDVYHNIFLDPQFVDPDSGDYHLTANSPCIDAGDPSSPFDPDSTIADMGAFYFYHEVGVQEKPKVENPTVFSLLPPYPNPFNPTTTIRFGLPVASRVTLEVFDITGRNVGAHGMRPSGGGGGSAGASLAPLQEWYPAGYHEIAFDGSTLASGIYICRIQAGDFIASQKLVLLK